MHPFPRPIPRSLRSVALVSAALGLLGVAACGPATDAMTTAATPTATPTASASPTSGSTEPTTASATTDDCFRLDALPGWALPSGTTPVPCTPGTYNVKTISTAELPLVVTMPFPEFATAADAITSLPAGEDPPKDMVTTANNYYLAEVAPFQKQCDKDVQNLLGLKHIDGMDQETLHWWTVTGPNAQEWAAGDRSLRCIVTLALGPDVNRADNTLLDLPADLAGAAGELGAQVCWSGPYDTMVVLPCDSPDLPDDSWLLLTGNKLLTEFGPYPGMKASKQLVFDACRAYAEHFTKPGTVLTNTTLDSGIAAAGNQLQDGMSWKQMWNAPGQFVQCAVRKDLFAGAR